MSRPPDDKKNKSGPRAQPGAVQHDARGNAVWQWAVDTGKQAIESTSRLLRRLELPGLSLEGDETEKKPTESKKLSIEPDTGGGYDPYGRSTANKPRRGAATASKPAARPVAARPQAKPVSPRDPEPGSRRSSWWRRLLGRR
jgi:hypothetical protein